MSARTANGDHSLYDTKPLYALRETVFTADALRKITDWKRGAIITRLVFDTTHGDLKLSVVFRETKKTKKKLERSKNLS